MACPFAHFKRSMNSVLLDDSRDGNINNEAGPSSLTSLLKTGTSEAHREIERSVGVRALMGSFHAERTIRLERIDHLRFLIMLTAVYFIMESVLVQNDTVLTDMMPLLSRSQALLDDVQLHLDKILDTDGAKASDLGISIEDEIDEEEYENQAQTFRNIDVAQRILTERKLIATQYSLLTPDHVAMLTQRQLIATKRYMDQILSFRSPRPPVLHYDEGVSLTPLDSPQSAPSSPVVSPLSLSTSSPPADTLTRSVRFDCDYTTLAHAYVRYLGDLSGGQHIVKRLSKLFPIHHRAAESGENGYAGFRFYDFSCSSKTNSELKEMIRTRLDSLDLTKREAQRIVDDASEAFRLNRGLLDSLVDEDSAVDFSISISSTNTLRKGRATTPLWKHRLLFMPQVPPLSLSLDRTAVLAALTITASLTALYTLVP